MKPIPSVVAAIEAAGAAAITEGKFKYTVAGSRGEWDNTGELRIVRDLSHRGREERLQQKFYCRINGDIEWVDVPIMDSPKSPAIQTSEPRPHDRGDGVPTRIDMRHWTLAEHAIALAMQAVEQAGASVALTDAVTLLGKARDRVADHVEGIP